NAGFDIAAQPFGPPVLVAEKRAPDLDGLERPAVDRDDGIAGRDAGVAGVSPDAGAAIRLEEDAVPAERAHVAGNPGAPAEGRRAPRRLSRDRRGPMIVELARHAAQREMSPGLVPHHGADDIRRLVSLAGGEGRLAGKRRARRAGVD